MSNKYKIDFGKPVQIIKVIRTTMAKDKDGKPLIQYWDLNGTLIAEEVNYQQIAEDQVYSG